MRSAKINKPLSNEHKKHIQESLPKGKDHKRARNVSCYDKKGNFIKQYDCIMDASRELNIDRVCISMVCGGHRKTTGGYKFQYLETTLSKSINY